jgi:hypothetical protein
MTQVTERKETESRYGFHPCNYETCALLKRLCLVMRKHTSLAATWYRQEGKQPQNRPLNRPQPNFKLACPETSEYVPVPDWPATREAGKLVTMEAYRSGYHIDHFWLARLYKRARMPQPTQPELFTAAELAQIEAYRKLADGE